VLNAYRMNFMTAEITTKDENENTTLGQDLPNVFSGVAQCSMRIVCTLTCGITTLRRHTSPATNAHWYERKENENTTVG
jgi:hypothetical protein